MKTALFDGDGQILDEEIVVLETQSPVDDVTTGASQQ